MSVQIKSLTNGVPTPDTSPDIADSFNTIPAANTVHDIYTAPKGSSVNRAAVVKGIRLVNIKAETVNISLYFNRPDQDGRSRRRLLAPKGMGLLAGATYIDDGEISMEPGDSLQMEASQADAIQYIISGVERDLT